VQDSIDKTNSVVDFWVVKAVFDVRPPTENFALHVLESAKDLSGVSSAADEHHPSAVDGGVASKQVVDESLFDTSDSNNPCATSKARDHSSFSGAPRRIAESVKNHVASTFGVILGEQLTFELTEKLLQEEEKEARAANRLNRTFRSSSVSPPSSPSSHGVTSSVVQALSQHQDLVASSISSAIYIGSDPRLEGDSPTTTVFYQTSSVPTTEAKPGLWSSLKGRAKSLLGVSDEQASLEGYLEPQGNEVGGLGKEIVLGSKDALGPGKGSKSGQEMQEISERIRAETMKRSPDRNPEALGIFAQGNEVGGLHKDLLEKRKIKLSGEKKDKRGLFARVFGRSKL